MNIQSELQLFIVSKFAVVYPLWHVLLQIELELVDSSDIHYNAMQNCITCSDSECLSLLFFVWLYRDSVAVLFKSTLHLKMDFWGAAHFFTIKKYEENLSCTCKMPKIVSVKLQILWYMVCTVRLAIPLFFARLAGGGLFRFTLAYTHTHIDIYTPMQT